MKKQYKIEGQSAEHAMSDPADTNKGVSSDDLSRS